MNDTLSKFMMLAITAVVIGALIYGALYDKVNEISNDVSTYIANN